MSAEYSNWKCKVFQTTINDINVLVLRLPHLSRYPIDKRPSVVGWIKKMIEEHENGTQFTKVTNLI